MSREAIIRRIVEREFQEQSLTEEAVLRDAPDLHHAACERFGTWNTALQYAGVNPRRLCVKQDYTRERVVQTIRALCRKGYSLKARDNMCRDRRLYEAARRHFGCWRRALRESGIEVKRANLRSRPRRLDKRQIVQVLQRRHRAGQSLRWGCVCMEDRALATAAKHAFHGWRRALAAAGIIAEAKPSMHQRKWDKERVIAAIQIRRLEGKPMYYKRTQRDDSPLVCAARRYFGSWDTALAAAGVESVRRSAGRRAR